MSQWNEDNFDNNNISLYCENQFEYPLLLDLTSKLDYTSEQLETQLIQQQIEQIGTTLWTVTSELKNNQFFRLSASLTSAGGSAFQVQRLDIQLLFLYSLMSVNCKIAPGSFNLDQQTGVIGYQIYCPLYQTKELLNIYDYVKYPNQIMRDTIEFCINDLIVLGNLSLANSQRVEDQCQRIQKLLISQTDGEKINSDLFNPVIKNQQKYLQLNEIQIFSALNDHSIVKIFATRRANSNIINKTLALQQMDCEEDRVKLIVIGDQLSEQRERFAGYHPYLEVYFHIGNEIYIEQKFQQQKTLQFYLQQNQYKVSLCTKLPIIQKICVGIYHLHQNGIIHTFINLNSISVEKENVPKIGFLQYAYQKDMGIKHSFRNSACYTPPEYRESEQITEKTDIYQIGILILQFAFMIPEEELVEMTTKDITHRILKAGLPEINVCIASLVHRCLDNNPTMRPTIRNLILVINQIVVGLQKLYIL